MANSWQDRPNHCHEAGKPLHRIHLTDKVRSILARNVRVTVDVCATGEPCAQVRRCGNEAHVRVIIHDTPRYMRALCADHWLALQEIYGAISGNRVHYGPGARNIIGMRRTPQPSDGLDQTKKRFDKGDM
jgi:hypothetical protein